MERKIAAREHNRFLTDGVAPHKATRIAPLALVAPMATELEHTLRRRAEAIRGTLEKALGKPAYSRDGCFVYCGDANELLAALLKRGFRIDLTVTSPPYNIGKEYERAMPVDDYVAWCSSWMTAIHAATKDSGAFWLNLGYLEVPGKGLCVPIPYLLWNRSPFYLLQEIVWQYGAGVAAKRRLSPRNEKWLYYVKSPDDYTFNLDDIRDPNVKYPNQRKHGKFRCNPHGKNPSDVWQFPKVTTGANRSSKERTGHPAQFPLPVVERIIRASSNAAEIVLDPFAGSCSTGLAAIGLGRLFLGFEIADAYCQVAAQRLDRFFVERDRLRKQMSLF